ncbi:MAG: phenylalanine--tRNA ligase subunit beta [Candidatus Aenigmarchaeota archaeon]|nr:phenylalanine--tRNA ligase subunit beta [Candidatus Aenigmarchaeota archaeon]
MMPTIEFSLKDLENLLGRKIDIDELRNNGILFVKGEIEEENEDVIKVDIKDTNRPDLWSVEGIARELRGHYKIKEGLPEFKIKKSGLKVIVDKKVENVRPKTVCAVVKNLKLSDDAIKQIIQLQEKIAQTFGRNRDLAAIGVYDYDKIKGPIRYTTFKSNELKFVPLGFSKEMTLGEILKEHPKGKKYGYLLEGKKEYPIFIDSKNNVLSMPPIINSNYTGKVDENTRNAFIEVSGHNLEHISIALNIMVTALHERGGEVYSVEVNYGKDKIITPDLKPRKAWMNIDECRKILGLDISPEEMVELLRQSRFDAVISGNRIEVKYIPYRNDIISERDIMEDVAISFGYNNIEPEEPKFFTHGEELHIEEFSSKIREICIGLGLEEILTFTLSSKEDLLKKMRISDENLIEISNPISSNWEVFRNSLIPGGLRFLSNNKHVEYPQKIFEIGNVLKMDECMETKTKDIRNLSIILTDNTIGYENISSVLDALMRLIGIKYSLEEIRHKSFIEGRCASITVNGKKIGIMGEIHPEVLENFELERPVVALEINLDKLMRITS